MKLSKPLETALGKARPFSDTKEWCGCLTPVEILALVNDGHKACNPQDVVWAKQHAQKGESKAYWFYFFATGENKPKFVRHKKHHKPQTFTD